MKKLPKECIHEKGNKPKISLRKNRSQFLVENPKKLEVTIFTVDGCLISDGMRCDYLILVDIKNREIFLELKGCDVNTAVNQLETSIQKLSSAPKSLAKECFIISTRVPKADTSIQRAKQSFKKKYKAQLTVKNRFGKCSV